MNRRAVRELVLAASVVGLVVSVGNGWAWRAIACLAVMIVALLLVTEVPA